MINQTLMQIKWSTKRDRFDFFTYRKVLTEREIDAMNKFRMDIDFLRVLNFLVLIPLPFGLLIGIQFVYQLMYFFAIFFVFIIFFFWLCIILKFILCFFFVLNFKEDVKKYTHTSNMQLEKQ